MTPTFRDSLFDVWKIQYNDHSSELIQLAKSLTHQRFIQALTPQKIVGDIAFQVGAMLAAHMTGKVVGLGLVYTFAKAGSAYPGIGTAIGFVVGMLTYWIINSIHATEQQKEMNAYIASQTTKNENYVSTETLSEKWWADEYFGNTMPDTLKGSRAGVYEELKAETSDHIYEGQVILAPHNVQKTQNTYFGSTLFGVDFNELVLDYSQQTRSYLTYSDWDDPEGRLQPFFYETYTEWVSGFGVEPMQVEKTNPRDGRVFFMRNSIMYLEDEIQSGTENQDKPIDTIIPYMMANPGYEVAYPSLQFADSASIATPEFFLTYPIYVDNDKYDVLKEEHYHIYKIYDGTTDVVQLIPEDIVATRPLMSDIVGVEAHIVDTLETDYSRVLTPDMYTFNMITGQVIITSGFLDWKLNELRQANKDVSNYDVYFVLEFNIEKFRDISVERDDITSEQAQKVATMQSIHQSVLEYIYQFRIAEQTQQKLSEACYTVFVTIISTLITMGATTGINKMFAGVGQNLMTSAKLGQAAASAVGQTSKVAEGLMKVANSMIRTGSLSIGKNIFKISMSVLSECYTEVYVDPMIEAYVSNIAKDAGLNFEAQIWLSSLAETGREMMLSSVSTFMRAGSSADPQINFRISENLNAEQTLTQQMENINELKQEAIDKEAKRQERMEFITQGLSTGLMFFGAMFGGGFGTVGSMLGNILIGVGASMESIDSLKDIFKTALGQEHITLELQVNPNLEISDQNQHQLNSEWKEIWNELSTLTDSQAIDRELEMIEENDLDYLTSWALGTFEQFDPTPVSGQVAGAAVGPSNEGEDVEVWFRRNSRRLIDNIIDSHLDLRAKMGKETKKAISELMRSLEIERKYKIYKQDEIIRDELGREFISFNDPSGDFQAIMEGYEKNPNSYGGAIYAVQVFGDYYVGLTEVSLNKRFEQHLLDAMRGYVLSLDGIDHPKYHDLQKSIAKAFLILGYDIKDLLTEIDWFSSIRDFKERRDFIEGILESIKPFVQAHVFEIHFGVKKIGTQEKFYSKQFPLKLLTEKGILKEDMIQFSQRSSFTDYLDLKLNGLNMVYGGGGTGYKSLPMYDIAIMIALGLSAPKIARILNDEYGLQTSERTVQHKVADILGGSYDSQEEFLQPIIDHLVSVGIDRRDIYFAFKDAELSKYGWFVDWSYGKAILRSDISKICEIFNLAPESGLEAIKPYLSSIERYFAGTSESQWKKWIFDGMPIKKGKESPNTMEDLSGVSERKIRTIIKLIAEDVGVLGITEKYLVKNLKYKLHSLEAIQLISKGYVNIGDTRITLRSDNFHIILCKHILKTRGSSEVESRNYFENILFRGFSLEQIWARYHLGINTL